MSPLGIWDALFGRIVHHLPRTGFRGWAVLFAGDAAAHNEISPRSPASRDRCHLVRDLLSLLSVTSTRQYPTVFEDVLQARFIADLLSV